MLKHFKTIVVVASGWTFAVKEVADIMDRFDKKDINEKGYITLEELKHGLYKLRHQIPDADIEILMEAVSIQNIVDLGKITQ